MTAFHQVPPASQRGMMVKIRVKQEDKGIGFGPPRILHAISLQNPYHVGFAPQTLRTPLSWYLFRMSPEMVSIGNFYRRPVHSVDQNVLVTSTYDSIIVVLPVKTVSWLFGEYATPPPLQGTD